MFIFGLNADPFSVWFKAELPCMGFQFQLFQSTVPDHWFIYYWILEDVTCGWALYIQYFKLGKVVDKLKYTAFILYFVCVSVEKKRRNYKKWRPFWIILKTCFDSYIWETWLVISRPRLITWAPTSLNKF